MCKSTQLLIGEPVSLSPSQTSIVSGLDVIRCSLQGAVRPSTVRALIRRNARTPTAVSILRPRLLIRREPTSIVLNVSRKWPRGISLSQNPKRKQGSAPTRAVTSPVPLREPRHVLRNMLRCLALGLRPPDLRPVPIRAARNPSRRRTRRRVARIMRWLFAS